MSRSSTDRTNGIGRSGSRSVPCGPAGMAREGGREGGHLAVAAMSCERYTTLFFQHKLFLRSLEVSQSRRKLHNSLRSMLADRLSLARSLPTSRGTDGGCDRARLASSKVEVASHGKSTIPHNIPDRQNLNHKIVTQFNFCAAFRSSHPSTC